MTDDCAPIQNPMIPFYAAVEAVAEGKVAEVDIEHHHTTTEGSETILMMTVRREVRHFAPPQVLDP